MNRDQHDRDQIDMAKIAAMVDETKKRLPALTPEESARLLEIAESATKNRTLNIERELDETRYLNLSFLGVDGDSSDVDSALSENMMEVARVAAEEIVAEAKARAAILIADAQDQVHQAKLNAQVKLRRAQEDADAIRIDARTLHFSAETELHHARQIRLAAELEVEQMREQTAQELMQQRERTARYAARTLQLAEEIKEAAEIEAQARAATRVETLERTSFGQSGPVVQYPSQHTKMDFLPVAALPSLDFPESLEYSWLQAPTSEDPDGFSEYREFDFERFQFKHEFTLVVCTEQHLDLRSPKTLTQAGDFVAVPSQPARKTARITQFELCTTTLARIIKNLGSSASQWRPIGQHLSPEAVSALIENELSPRAHSAAIAHLELCESCADEVATRQFLADLHSAKNVALLSHFEQRILHTDFVVARSLNAIPPAVVDVIQSADTEPGVSISTG
ncbi:hypothetical protein [Lentzea flaviverrucosa]|uniref:Uncharacterized protein n=1 Tax=Lentzea flaviverrucosa TaxID=200379 RepID=A0A1H9XKH2_9PSEU|nr:hypothetical protein [Lentzea flaviverrucosa]RDI20344.1 hypothetical protein DFR72_115187 [Lentzea flaviverrucosa]SES46676.1 hypothetical protein SAMN05216195_115187 [Lentzea flaviverrucosa]